MATHSSILVGKSHRQRSTVGYRPWDRRAEHNWARAQTHTRIRSGTHAHIVLLARGAVKVFPRSVPTSYGFHIMTAPPSGFLWKSIPPPLTIGSGTEGRSLERFQTLPFIHSFQESLIATLPVLNNSALNHILSWFALCFMCNHLKSFCLFS